jgi:hypothetical protein
MRDGPGRGHPVSTGTGGGVGACAAARPATTSSAVSIWANRPAATSSASEASSRGARAAGHERPLLLHQHACRGQPDAGDQRGGGARIGRRVGRAVSRRLGPGLEQRLGQAALGVEDQLALPGPECVGGLERPHVATPFPGVERADQGARQRDEVAAQRRQRGGGRLAETHGLRRSVDPRSAPVEEQLLLGGEVVEDRLDRDISGSRDVGDRHGIEAALGEHALRHRAEELPRLGFLPGPTIL